jgi:hypothetical protein
VPSSSWVEARGYGEMGRRVESAMCVTKASAVRSDTPKELVRTNTDFG